MPDPDDLRAIGLLDGGTEPEFDRVATLAARLLRSQISLVSVIDEPNARQFLKASAGLPDAVAANRQTPLTHSFCKTVIAEARPVQVRDARLDPRFRNNPAIRDHGVIAYIGVPVAKAPGKAVASLCAIDPAPRDWTQDDLGILQTLADGLSGQVQLRLALRRSERVAEELRVANERFADLASNVPGAIFRYIAHSDGRDAVEYMSPGCFGIWETPAEAIMDDASKLWEIIVPDDVPGMAASIRRSAETMEPWEHRWRIVPPSGKTKWLQGYGQPKRLEDGAILWNSLILDVTVEVQAEQAARDTARQLAQAQRQESIGRLAGGVAHDFNNLLAIIMANAEIVLADQPAGAAAASLSDIIAAAERGSDLTRSLLSFARRSDLRPVALGVDDAVRGMDNLLRRTLPTRIAVEMRLAGGLWPVLADRSGLENALLNLVLNARDAMPAGGTLTIETANVAIADDTIAEKGEEIAPGRYVMLAVTDTGSGIAPELIDRVFEPFVTTKGPDAGSGLGLAMVQGFVRQSGGTVRLYSELGHGTSVKLFLPAHDAGDVRPAAPQARTISDATGTVLLVEDNDGVRRSVRLTLERAGHRVIDAESGDAAMALLAAEDPAFDVVVTDVVMPGRLQGPEMVRRIRDRRPAVPAVFVSGYPHEANVHGNGVRDSDIRLMKPVARADLLLAVGQALQEAARAKPGG